MFLKGVENLKTVEWAKSYLWDIKFENGPEHIEFDDWFPAIDVEEPLTQLETYQITGFLSNYFVPKSTAAFELRITFYDDYLHTVKEWLREWVNDIILGNGEYVATLGDEGVVKLVHIEKLSPQREQISMKSYWVYPTGQMMFHGDSNSGLVTNVQSFIVVSKII